jgi:hypothetical protein
MATAIIRGIAAGRIARHAAGMLNICLRQA